MSAECSSPNSGPPVSLDHLIGLCDEISALVRAGIPLEEALAEKGTAVCSRLGTHLKQLAEQLGTGRSLADALRNDSAFPPVYSAVVEAGIRSHDLAGALDSISQNARILREVRLFFLRISVYPLILFTFLWFVLAIVFLGTGPIFATFFDAFGAQTLMLDVMRWTGEHANSFLGFVVVVPILLWIGFYWWCVASAKGTMLQHNGFLSVFGWIPWIRGAAVQLRKMSFARICAMLLRSSVPLDEAILLAARATDDSYWSSRELEILRAHILEGIREKEARTNTTGTATVNTTVAPPAIFPRSPISPLIRWAVGVPRQSLLIEGMEQYAQIARTRAQILIDRCELFLPGMIMFGFAVLIGACYVLTIFWPYTQLLTRLSGTMN